MVLRCVNLGLVEYPQALRHQEMLLMQRYREEIGDTLLLVEHPSVFTLGRGAKERNLLTPRHIPVYRVGRGGDVTYHGPGQLIGYPIIHLGLHGRDVHAYLRGLEQMLIDTLARYDITAQRVDGLTGVWVGTQKISSIGVGVRHWVTYHGFALNVDVDLAHFHDIIPCGIAGVQMTSMTKVTGRPISVSTVKPLVADAFARYFGYEDIVWQNT